MLNTKERISEECGIKKKNGVTVELRYLNIFYVGFFNQNFIFLLSDNLRKFGINLKKFIFGPVTNLFTM